MTLLRAFLIDDESLARSRMRQLLDECTDPRVMIQGEASNAVQAMEMMVRNPCDVIFLDIRMPGVDGLMLAQHIRKLPYEPALIFITAFAEYAVQAFELEAVDYLTKPVSRERLQTALLKTQRYLQSPARQVQNHDAHSIVVHERNRTERIPLHLVLYLKAELKYITLRTSARSAILDGSLNDFEQQFESYFLRIHRNALVAKHAIRALERYHDPQEGEVWVVRLHGIDDYLVVSRRQLPTVRELIGRKSK